MDAPSSTVAVDPSMASSSSAAAEPRLPKYDVFLSFRGEDTRNRFTAHLYSALSGKQIRAYMDEFSLEQGSEISPELLKAIEESKISIIIFSKNYASSSWCLEELVHILKCKKEKDRIVLPIYVDIDPSHIRKQEKSYYEAFVGLEKRFEMEKVREWRRALTEAAGLSGWVSPNMSESKIVEKVVQRVKRDLDTINSKRSERELDTINSKRSERELDTINSKRSDNFWGLDGISKHLEKIKSVVKPTVHVEGNWGMPPVIKQKIPAALKSGVQLKFGNNRSSP